jgi:NADH-quinone oxidoreductase subunit J
MNGLEFAFFALCTLLTLVGGVITVAARNPIRSAMGLLASIVGIAGNYLLLSAEFLAAVQIIVYAGAVVVLFVFVIMLLGPSATSPRDARSAIPRYAGAGVFLASVVGLIVALVRSGALLPTQVAKPPPGFGSIEAIGHELFTTASVPFELSGALLLVAVVGAVAVARGKQPDPTVVSAADPAAQPAKSAAQGDEPVIAHGSAAYAEAQVRRGPSEARAG